jgi:hypothetical protein
MNPENTNNMKLRFTGIVTAIFFLLSFHSFAGKPLSYYLPEEEYDAAIPTPESFFGFQIGEWHLHHGPLLQYMQMVAEKSDRAIIYEYARSYEQRPLVHMIITSPENHRNLEEIRQKHLKLADPSQSSGVDIADMPVVVRLGYGVHGNEPSAHNAAPLVAYYLLASKSQEVLDMLDKMVIIIDPSLNPDGQDRFASWVNRHRSRILNPDPAGREFSDVWPGSRSNHYWFDLNRDWLPVQQVESQGRIKEYHRWLPNVNTDHHEFGANSTFYFQPGVPSRGNPLTPQRTDELTMEIARYHARAFDKVGQLYYTEEDFDDYYYGKGSSYPDVHGSIGILFEQAGTKGHRVETVHGVVDFSETVRNQVLVSFSSMEAACDLRLTLLEHLRWFFKSGLEEARKMPVQAYVFGDPYDQGRNYHFLEILQTHQIKIFKLKDHLKLGDHEFKPGSSWLVTLDQPQSRLIRSLFEKVQEFEDSLFYDVSTWTLPLAFNLPFGEITGARQLSAAKGDLLTELPKPAGSVEGGNSSYAYVFAWDDYFAPKALYFLQQHGLRTRVATQPFSLKIGNEEKEFGYGSILVPVQIQDADSDKVFELLQQATKLAGIKALAIETSLSSQGTNLGSSALVTLRKPEILMLVGQGTNSREAGEIWHLLDQRFDMPISMVETGRLNNLDLSRYNTIVMVSGSYADISQGGRESLDRWLRNGGTIVALGNANNWLERNGLAKIDFVKVPEITDPVMLPYADRSRHMGARRNPGSIFSGKLDITHPIGYGFRNEVVPVFISGNTFAKHDSSAYANPLIYKENNLMSGYIFEPYRPMIENSAGILINSQGRGNVISFMDNPNSRGFWFGTNRLFMNALFFGPIIRR